MESMPREIQTPNSLPNKIGISPIHISITETTHPLVIQSKKMRMKSMQRETQTPNSIT